MSANVENTSSPMDNFKLLLAVALLIGAVAGNYMYGEFSVLYRALAIVGLVVVAGFIAASTEKGRNAIVFAKESRTEVRKVVWPTRQESVQTTLIVLAATAAMSLLLWGIDNLIVWVISGITGLGI